MSISPTSWTCPYCNQPTTITSSDYHGFSEHLIHEDATGDYYLVGVNIVCPNPTCKQRTLTISLNKAASDPNSYGTIPGKPVRMWTLLPGSKAKPYPDYVPKAIRNDYEEACAIVELSPKSSATLARRALQGIIRNYWGIKPKVGEQPYKLVKEINLIKGLVDASLWDAIDGVRKVGNIGAHMEQDIDVVIDVDPAEAELLIGLIEFVITDTYIARHNREQGASAVTALAKAKTEAIKAAKEAVSKK